MGITWNLTFFSEIEKTSDIEKMRFPIKSVIHRSTKKR